MRVKIYQINPERDGNKVKFLSLKDTQSIQGKINPSIYDEVFNAELDTSNLEEVFKMMKFDGHPLMRSEQPITVSDVVVMNNKAYFCEAVGFAELSEFDESQTQKPNNLMRVVYVEPNKPAYETEIENSLAGEQKAVKGYIELVYNEDDTIIVCNDEAKLIGMDGNRYLDNGTSIIAGPFFIVGDNGEDFRSLTQEEVDYYVSKYAEPENISQEEVQGDMGFTVYGFN